MHKEFKQREGLCLMWYKCKECDKEEQIWNSRPRVTPFSISCSGENCKGHMIHILWEQDEYLPNYLPSPGERIFIDWSKETAEKEYTEYIEKIWEDLSKRFTTKTEALEALMDSWRFGQPTIFTLKPNDI
jgi:hypothetical protein